MLKPNEREELFRLITVTRNSIASQFDNLAGTLQILDRLITKLKEDETPGEEQGHA